MEPRRVKVINPATGGLVKEYEMTDISKMKDIFAAARKAQKIWAKKSFAERSVHIMKIKKYLYEKREVVARSVSICTGKTLTQSTAAGPFSGLMSCDYYTSAAKRVLGAKFYGPPSLLFFNKLSWKEHIPLGVVAIISPYNYPFSIPFGEIIMGLMAGNAIVMKCASQTVLVGEVIRDIITAGDLPPGLFHHVIGPGREITEEFFRQGVNKIFFTGSVGVGQKLVEQSAKNLTPLSLELGGNDPMIVMPSADLERATNGALWAGLCNTGQSCAAVERIYVHKDIYSKFLELLKKKVAAMRHGSTLGKFMDKVTMGPLSNPQQLEVVKLQFQDALDKGAKVEAQSSPIGEVGKGFFFPATILSGVTHDMLCMREETFGPLLPVMQFENVEQVIRFANRSQYSLTASVWTHYRREGFEIAKQLEYGTVTLNDHLLTHGCCELPWGGWKLTGLGRTHGEEGLKEMSNVRVIMHDIMPTTFAKRNVFWYPHDATTYHNMAHIASAYVMSRWAFMKLWYLLRMVPFMLGKQLSSYTPWKAIEEEKKKKKEKPKKKIKKKKE